jgi:peroxiredoxin
MIEIGKNLRRRSMAKKIIAAIALVVLFTVAMVNAMGKEEQKVDQVKDNQSGLEVGNKAPDFELKLLTGETVKLSDYKGKRVMLNFWATWCPPCKKEMPDMQKLHLAHQDDITILAVNMDVKSDVAGFAKEMGITFPILLDEKDEVNQDYQILTIPTSFFIDENGVIYEKFNGAMTFEDMKKYAKVD